MPQSAAARQCIYRNHLLLSAVLAMFEEDWAPPHLAPANAAADEYEDKVGAAVAPQDHDKVRWVGDSGKRRVLWWSTASCAVPGGGAALAGGQAAQALLQTDAVTLAASALSDATRNPGRYVLKNCARDWSAEGAAERAQSYGRITAELRHLFAGWPADAAQPPSVLVPGAGLGRLCLEIVNMVRRSGWAG